jgi:glycosyltransferase involved in cell wall biosynthesis
MKVAYVLQSARGGIPHYVACLANAISRYADVVVLKPDKTTADEVFSSRVEIVNAFKSANLSYVDLYRKRFISFRTFGGLLSYKNINIVRNIKPDIIHFAGGLIPPMQAFIRLYKLDKLFPLIVTFHDVPPRKYLVLPKKISETLILVAINVMNFLNLLMPKIKYEKVIVHTQKNRERLIERGSPSEKIVVIPHGAYDFFKKYGNYSKMEEERNCILFFGNIVEAKAVDVLIDAIPIIAKEIPEVKLVIAGDGVIPKKSWGVIEKFKPNFEIHNYFIPNEKVWEFFSRACVVVIPNRRQEGHSGSLTVAYSFGKPVVTTNVGEFPVLVKDAGCGLVVPPEDPKALAEAIIKLLKDEKLRKEMGRNALKKAEELSWDNIAKMHMKVYEEVLNEWGKKFSRVR